MEINIQDRFPILKTFTKPTDRICLTSEELNSAIKDIVIAVLQEAADSAKLLIEHERGEYYTKMYTLDGSETATVNKESITSTINKVKF